MINLIRPTLPAPSVCDIIDINPGPCIWSQALHEALKPRSHALIEPEGSDHRQTAEALANTAGSKYHLARDTNHALDLATLSQGFRNHYGSLNEEQRKEARRQPTDQLIITANLSGKRVSNAFFHGAPCKLFLDQFYRSIAFDAGAYEFNRYGLVRLLAWVPEQEKHGIVPRTTAWRYRPNKNQEASCHVREIVSSHPYHGLNPMGRPWHDVALESRRIAAERQRINNITMPTDRVQPLPQPPFRYYDPIPENFDAMQSFEGRPAVVDEFIDLWQSVESEHEDWLLPYIEATRQGKRPRLPKEELLRTFARMNGRMRTAHNSYRDIQEMISGQIALEQELISLRRQHPDDKAPYLMRLEELKPEFEKFKSIQAKSYKDNRHAILKGIDDFRALYHDPPILSWHARPHEPLLCHPKKDFQPTREPLSLLEFVPKTSFVNAIDTSDKQITFDYITVCFDYARVTSLKKALEDLVGEGELYEAFLEGLPSLTDPLYGGWHDLSDIRTRALSVEAMVEIAVAYEAWPYRIEIERMLERIRGFGRGAHMSPFN